MSYFTEIKPKNSKNTAGCKSWKFMLYQESPSEREDEKWYCAFLFRDSDRSVFGIKEFFGDNTLHMNKYRDLAAKVLNNTLFRESLVSNDPELPQLWKKH